MHKLTRQKRAQIIGMIVEGMSIRSITRLTGASKNTVAKLLVDAGDACLEYQRCTLRDLPCRRLQCDEIWSFVGAKDKNIPAERRGETGIGSVWTWTAIDADTKLVPCFHVGPRDAGAACDFIMDLAERLANRVQLTTDGHKAYLNAVDFAFGGQVDYAMLVKVYVPSRRKRRATARQSASAPGASRSQTTPTPSTWPRRTSSGRTCRCGWGCGASPV